MMTVVKLKSTDLEFYKYAEILIGYERHPLSFFN